MQTVSDDSFASEVLASDKPVLVDFWAEWCGPCKPLAVTLGEISEEMGEHITIAKLNMDENPQAPSTYGVRSAPTMMIFRNGEVVASLVGLQSKSKLVNWIKGAI